MPSNDARLRRDVPGAADALDAFLAGIEGLPEQRGAVDGEVPPTRGLIAARALSGASVDWTSIRATIVDSEGAVILAEREGGPVIAARFFDPAAPTTIHDHGGPGAALVVEGRDRYERFRWTGANDVRLESIHDLHEGDVIWWNDPPGDVHRQHGVGQGAIELVLLANYPDAIASFTDTTPEQPPLHAAIVNGFLDGDTTILAPWYAPGLFVDANVPEWRFQMRGRHAFLAMLDAEEFRKQDRRLTFVRLTGTADGILLETELRFTHEGIGRVCRETHVLRVDGGLVTEHAIWCTGVAEAAQARRQFETAPMERP